MKKKRLAPSKLSSGQSEAITADSIMFPLNRRELATILAALRFHPDENLQGGGVVPDRLIRDIATDAGTLKPLIFAQVKKFCHRLNFGKAAAPGLHIYPPHREPADQPLFRLVYIIDLNASEARHAAEQAHEMLQDFESMAPVLHVLGPGGAVAVVNLSRPSAATAPL